MKTLEDARPLFEAGKSVNAVAREPGISWYDASKFRAALNAPEEADAPQADAEPGEEVSEEDSDLWNVPLSVPASKIDDLLRTMTAEDAISCLLNLDIEGKFEAWRGLMQRRIDAILAPAESEGA